jgi:hypothetical protein
MPNVERDRSGSPRPRIHFVIGKMAAPLAQVFIRQLQRVQNGTPYCGHIWLSAAQPWFCGLCGFCGWHGISDTLVQIGPPAYRGQSQPKVPAVSKP